jgi:hypothetical protein
MVDSVNGKTIEIKRYKLIIGAILGIVVIIASVMIYKFLLPVFMLPNL